MKIFSLRTDLLVIQTAVLLTVSCTAAAGSPAIRTPQSASRTSVEPTVARDAGFKRMLVGLCEDYPEESRTITLARRDLQVLRTNDIPILRVAFGWDAIEPRRGEYDWGFWDEFVSMAVEEFKITLIPYVCYTPKWAASKPGKDSWRSPPKSPDLFADFMRTIVSRYIGRIGSWELWNEPDNQHYWTGTTEEFAQLLRAGIKAVHDADPDAKTVLGGLAWNLDFLKDIATEGALQNIGIVNLHNYYETWSDDPLERLSDYVGRASDILHNNKIDARIWMAELGYSSYRSNQWVSAQYQAKKEFEHTSEHQAASLFRAMTLLQASGKVELAAWYRINDLPPAQDVIGDVNNRHLGILDAKGNPKPSLLALAFFNRLFKEGYKDFGKQVNVKKSLNSRVQTFAFETPGAVVVAAWTPTRIPGDHVQPDSNDQALRGVSLELPNLWSTPVLYDETGRIKGVLPIVDEKEKRTRITIVTDHDGVSVIVIPRKNRSH